jgi:hypothetical protein
MSDTSQVIIAVIGSQIAATALVLTALNIVWNSLNRRFDDFRTAIDQRFKDFSIAVDAKIETLRVEIRADIEALRVEVRELDKQITRRIISGR